MEAKQFRIPKRVAEIADLSLKGGLWGLGLYHIAMTCNLDDFLRWLTNGNRRRGEALQSAIKADPHDELRLLQNVTPLTVEQGKALANKAANTRINYKKGKLHQSTLTVIGAVAYQMINPKKKK